MVPETTTRTEEQPATKTDDVIKAFERDDAFTRLNHRVDAAVDGVPVRAVFSMGYTNTTMRVLVTDDAEVIETDPHGDHCSACEANEAHMDNPEPRDMPRERLRRKNNCQHANVASRARKVGVNGGNACSNCGHFAVAVKETPITRRISHAERIHVATVEERRCGHCAHHR